MSPRGAWLAVGGFALLVPQARAQSMEDMPMPAAAPAAPSPASSPPVQLPPPINDRQVQIHGILDQLENRSTGSSNNLRYEGLAWAGTDYDKLYFKFEGTRRNNGIYADGINEILYARAVSTYFDVQTGIRVDLDSGRGRTWYALGIQGLAVQFFNVEATAYVSDGGHLAAKFNVSYDVPITNRLYVQPQAELNVYSKPDPGRGVGSGVSELDAGLRVRYEITRKFAPYIGVAYQKAFGQTAGYSRREGSPVNDVRFVFGARVWF